MNFKIFTYSILFTLIILTFSKPILLSAQKHKKINMNDLPQNNVENIKVLELRNYLLKPNVTNKFSHYFHSKFVEPMNKLGGYTLGEYKINEVNDRFVWFRGFTDMKNRVKFLNDFYINSPTWKEYGKGANEMMINSDNVYLLKPLNKITTLKTDKAFTVIDFYICNSTIERVIELFDTAYIPFLKTIKIEDISLWVSEMAENDFPRLPVFQDKNLLVSITNYKDKQEYEVKQKEIDDMANDLKKSMQGLITTQNRWVLLNQNKENITTNDSIEIPKINFDKNGELIITASPTSSKTDFDFFEGKWDLKNKKLKSKLNGCKEWIEFHSTQEMYKTLNGIGNVDNFLATFDGEPFEGMTVRLFNPKTKLWSIYWADSNEGKFDPPVVGSFENKVAHFFTKDIFEGKPILVVFRWDAIDKENSVWSQAFSDDNGTTWEWNWYMYFSKSKN
jgi:hypothetical protein